MVKEKVCLGRRCVPKGVDAKLWWFTFVTKRCFFHGHQFSQMHMVINISLDLLIGTWDLD
jgi:hypothetical protein